VNECKEPEGRGLLERFAIRVWNSGRRLHGSGYRVHVLRFRVLGSGFGV